MLICMYEAMSCAHAATAAHEVDERPSGAVATLDLLGFGVPLKEHPRAAPQAQVLAQPQQPEVVADRDAQDGHLSAAAARSARGEGGGGGAARRTHAARTFDTGTAHLEPSPSTTE